jgi:hypothetical protein
LANKEKQFQLINEISCLLFISFNFKGKNRAAASGKLLFYTGSVFGVRGHCRMMHCSTWGCFCRYSTAAAHFHMPFHRKERVSNPCRNKKAWKGESVAPVSRKKNGPNAHYESGRPTAWVKLMP